LANSLLSFSDELASMVERTAQSVVAVHARRRFDSSGVHWSPGIIVTASHTIRRDDEIRVTSASGATLDAELVGRDPGTDLAVLRAKSLDAHAISKPGGTKPQPGQLALAVGRSKESPIAALGVVGSLSGASQTWRGGKLDRVIRIALELHPGAAGGAIINASGALIGIATQALSRFSVFAIPPETVTRVSQQLLSAGRIPRGYLGAGLQPIAIPEHLKSKLSLAASSGLIAISVDPDAPAGRAGLSIGDVLIELGGQTVSWPEKVQELLDADSIGKTMPVKILRGGTPTTLEVTVGERPRKE
jgi:S1-C subfamily serine protease